MLCFSVGFWHQNAVKSGGFLPSVALRPELPVGIISELLICTTDKLDSAATGTTTCFCVSGCQKGERCTSGREHQAVIKGATAVIGPCLILHCSPVHTSPFLSSSPSISISDLPQLLKLPSWATRVCVWCSALPLYRCFHQTWSLKAFLKRGSQHNTACLLPPVAACSGLRFASRKHAHNDRTEGGSRHVKTPRGRLRIRA